MQMKRRRPSPGKRMIKRTSRSWNPPVVVDDESSMQVCPGVVLVDGCVVGGRKDRNVHKPQDAEDFNDIFPDEILVHIFSHIWRPENCWDAAKVCKRWYILLAYNQLRKRGSHNSGRYPCIAVKKENWLPRKGWCDGSSKIPLKLNKVESEWRLAMDFLNSCKRHKLSLEIKDCTHVSVRGYQLIAGFASNLRSIRLESCNTLDDPSVDTILDNCTRLRSIHLSMVPKLTLRNIEKKAPKLQELHVYGCRHVIGTSVLAILKGCPNLRSLCLSAMGDVSLDDGSCNIGQGPALKLQSLQLVNTLAVTDEFLRAVSGRLCNLRKLDLSDCASMSDDGFKAMIASCGSRLQKLVVSRCPQISDESVGALAGVAANLQDLSLAGTNVSDDGLHALLASKAVLAKLRHLSLACCQSVTDAGFQHMVSQGQKLLSFRVLDIQGCGKVSGVGLKSIMGNTKKRPWKIVS